jgi:hypothetical protein
MLKIVKGLSRGGLFDYGVYSFLTMQGRYLCPGDSSTPSLLRHCLLAYKENTHLKKITRLMQESNSPKTDFDLSQSLIDPPPLCLVLGAFFNYHPFPSNQVIPWIDHWPIGLTRLTIDWPGQTGLTIGGFR